MIIFKSLSAVIALIFVPTVMADWGVHADSKVYFVSVKNNNVGEINYFNNVDGIVNSRGDVSIVIDLTSVETGIDIRNERIKKMLFGVDEFPTATVRATLSSSQLDALNAGASVSETVKVTVGLHGVSVDKLAALTVGVSEGGLRVTSTQPIVVTAQDFGLESGVAALQAIAGLNAISRSIPITVDLSLRAN